MADATDELVRRFRTRAARLFDLPDGTSWDCTTPESMDMGNLEPIIIGGDIAYGPDPRQVLDVFASPGASGCDVLVFVHGGAFVRGAKQGPEGLYGNVLTWFARQGFVGVNIEYRLAPEAAYPGGAEDVGRAVSWVRENIAAHGGDPARIILFGHSAGAHLAALLATNPRFLAAVGESTERIRGVVPISGTYWIDAGTKGGTVFGPDPAAHVLLAVADDGAVSGMALWFRTFSTFLGRSGIWLEDLFVRPELRGQGIGKALGGVVHDQHHDQAGDHGAVLCKRSGHLWQDGEKRHANQRTDDRATSPHDDEGENRHCEREGILARREGIRVQAFESAIQTTDGAADHEGQRVVLADGHAQHRRDTCA